MKLVGITGSIASGKTSILNYYGSQGYFVFNSDQYVKQLYCDLAIQRQLLDLFPIMKTFSINKLRNLIYQDFHKLKLIESIIHPLVQKKILGIKVDFKKHNIVFAEVPLLFEAKLSHLFDYTVTIVSDDAQRLARAKKRSNFYYSFYKFIEQSQFSQCKKALLSDFVVHNSLGKKFLIKQLEFILKKTIFEK